LGLTEGEVRGGLRVLERVGFVAREPFEKRNAYRATENGLRRSPLLFRFGHLFQLAFQAVNRWKAMRDRVRSKRPITSQPKTNNSYNPEPKAVFTGSVRRASERTVVADPTSPLEAALAALGRAILRS